MRLKLFSLITVLTLIGTTSATPSKVEAQGLVEYAILLVLVKIDSGETLELQLGTESVNQLPQLTPTGTYTVSNTLQILNDFPNGEEPCEQTVQVVVETRPGRIIPLKVSSEDEFSTLTINGGEPVALEECFHSSDSIGIAVVDPISNRDGDTPRRRSPTPLLWRLIDNMDSKTIATQSLVNHFDRKNVIAISPSSPPSRR